MSTAVQHQARYPQLGGLVAQVKQDAEPLCLYTAVTAQSSSFWPAALLLMPNTCSIKSGNDKE